MPQKFSNIRRLTFIQLPPIPNQPTNQQNKQTNKGNALPFFLSWLCPRFQANRSFRADLQCHTLETIWTHWSFPLSWHYHVQKAWCSGLTFVHWAVLLDQTSGWLVLREMIFIFLLSLSENNSTLTFYGKHPIAFSSFRLTLCLLVSFSIYSTPNPWPVLVWYSKLAWLCTDLHFFTWVMVFHSYSGCQVSQ